MINLLPQKEKALITKEYHLRRLALYLVMLLVLALVAVVLLLPSYVLSLYKKNAAELSYIQPPVNDQEESKELLSRVNKGKAALSALVPEQPAKLPIELVTLITSLKTDDNTINSIKYTFKPPQSFEVVVTGVAETRQSLVAFKNALEAVPGLDKVELPVSNFAKDSNINFSLILKNKQ